MASTAITTEHVIIIDDSNRVRSILASTIISGCASVGKDAYLIQSSTFGIFTHTIGDLRQGMGVPDVIVGVADCARNALELLDPVLVRRAIILCDIETPEDMQVGLFGLLDHLARTAIPVNLIFMSSEAQNVNCVRGLIARRKAWFVEKGSDAWVQLPVALINNLDKLQYQAIATTDYDAPFLAAVQLPVQPAPAAVEPPLAAVPVPAAPQIPPAPVGFWGKVRNWLQGLRVRFATQ